MSPWEFLKEIVRELFRWTWDEPSRFEPIRVEIED